MKSQFDYAILDAIGNAVRTVKASPLILGGVPGSGGGIGGPPGGFVGWLPQTRVAYDLDELAMSGFVQPGAFNEGFLVSGSLLDNLNHIRYRIAVLESGGGGGSGASNFIDLLDVPSDYSGFGGYVVGVKSSEDGLEFVVMSGGGSLPTFDPARVPYTDAVGEIKTSDLVIYNELDGFFNLGGVTKSGLSNGAPAHSFASDSLGGSAAHNMYTWGASFWSRVKFVTAEGTPNVPQAVQSGKIIGGLRAVGFDGNTAMTSAAGNGELRFKAIQNFTASGHGTNMEVWLAPSGSTTMQLIGEFFPSGINLASGMNYFINGDLFESGGGGSDSSVYNETPAGSINGSNTSYTTLYDFVTGTLRVYLNGQRLTASGADYTEGSQAFVMTTAPEVGDVLKVDYARSNSENTDGTVSIVSNEIPSGTVNGTNAVFTTASSYVSGSLLVFRDGQLMTLTGDYTQTGANQFTFVTAPSIGSVIVVNYQSAVSSTGNADTLDGYHASAFDTISSYSASAVTTSNVTGVAGTLHNYDISGLTADRDFSLPTPTSAGKRITVRISTGDDTYELIIKRNSIELTRLFISGEFLTFLSTGTGIGDWIVETDGRIPCIAVFRRTGSNYTPAAYTGGDYLRMDWDHATLDVGNCIDLTNDRFKARRNGYYKATSGIAFFSSIPDQEYAGIIIFKNGNGASVNPTGTTRIGVIALRQSGASAIFGATPAFRVVDLVADDLLYYYFTTQSNAKVVLASNGVSPSLLEEGTYWEVTERLLTIN